MPIIAATETLTRNKYAMNDLEKRIINALEASGKNLSCLRPDDLAPVDEFHIRGRMATTELAESAAINSDMRVLDVGCGIGGPARFLAARYGCQVTGIDLNETYCKVAENLTGLVKLSHLVDFQHANALYLPFPDASFHVVWTQHTAMNIADKTSLYQEFRRVLVTGGTLALYDILAGPVTPLHFPVPWASGPDASFLAAPDELRQHLQLAGFSISTWEDTTDLGEAWFMKVIQPATEPATARPLGLHLLMGNEFRAMTANQLLNLKEGRIRLYQVTANKLPHNSQVHE